VLLPGGVDILMTTAAADVMRTMTMIVTGTLRMAGIVIGDTLIMARILIGDDDDCDRYGDSGKCVELL